MELEKFYNAIDGDYIETLERFMDRNLVQKYVVKFKQNDAYAILIEGLEKNDPKTAFRGIHTLKGTAGMLGFTPLYREASILADMFRPDENDEYKPLRTIDYGGQLDIVMNLYIDVLNKIVNYLHLKIAASSNNC